MPQTLAVLRDLYVSIFQGSILETGLHLPICDSNDAIILQQDRGSTCALSSD